VIVEIFRYFSDYAWDHPISALPRTSPTEAPTLLFWHSFQRKAGAYIYKYIGGGGKILVTVDEFNISLHVSCEDAITPSFQNIKSLQLLK